MPRARVRGARCGRAGERRAVERDRARAAGSWRPATQRSSVDLPLPLSPTMPRQRAASRRRARRRRPRPRSRRSRATSPSMDRQHVRSRQSRASDGARLRCAAPLGRRASASAPAQAADAARRRRRLERRHGGVAGVDRELAAGRERAAGRPVPGLDRRPGDARAARTRSASTRGTASRSRRVYGCRGRAKTSSTAPCSTIRPPYMHGDVGRRACGRRRGRG